MLVLTLVLTGCVTRPPESPQFRDALPQDAVSLEQPGPDNNSSGDDGVINILALSGGGAYGAYGVGILNGWSERGTRPQFDIVTGVSTGALMSVFAFLGPHYDARLRDLYTNTRKEDIFTSKGITGPVWRQSV